MLWPTERSFAPNDLLPPKQAIGGLDEGKSAPLRASDKDLGKEGGMGKEGRAMVEGSAGYQPWIGDGGGMAGTEVSLTTDRSVVARIRSRRRSRCKAAAQITKITILLSLYIYYGIAGGVFFCKTFGVYSFLIIYNTSLLGSAWFKRIWEKEKEKYIFWKIHIFGLMENMWV